MSTESDQGLEALKRGDANAAIPLLEQAIQNDASDFNAHVYLGAAYAQANRANDSVTILTQAVHLQPSNPQARFNLGIALQKAGWTNEAATAFEQALSLQPDYPQAQQALNALRPPQAVPQAQIPTQVISPQQAPAPSYQPPQYSPVNPQQGYAPPQEGYGRPPQSPYGATQSPYPYPTMDVDREKNRKGLLMYGYGGYAMIFIIIASFVVGVGDSLLSFTRLLGFVITVIGVVMAIGMALVYSATKVKSLGFVAFALLLERLPSVINLFGDGKPQPSPFARGASPQSFSPEMLAAAGGALVLGIVFLVAIFAALYYTCTGFREVAQGLNNSLAESQAESAANTFRVSAYILLGGIGGMILTLASPIFAILGGLAFIVGGLGLFLCWGRTLITAVTLANS